MEKYIGNKKSILEDIEEFMLTKNINTGVFCDIFTGTTNVAQYFKQRGFSIISNDANEFCYPLQKAYIENNGFPLYGDVISYIINSKGFTFDQDEIENMRSISIKKIINDKIFRLNYEQETDYRQNIIPLIKVVSYLNSISIDNLNDQQLFFYEYYTQYGSKSGYKSSRGTIGRRNYFNEYNSKKLGVILNILKDWYVNKRILNDNEFFILLTSVIEEVTLVANVNGTFHDFNRHRLYPNALVNMAFKPPILNIVDIENLVFKCFNEDSNKLFSTEIAGNINSQIEILYIDPPYNFRQYSAYYHLLNFIAKYHEIGDLSEYGKKLEFVRGQNMEDNFESDYCYKDKFSLVLRELIKSTNARHVIISYYDENNHWSHGKDGATDEGRETILNILSDKELFAYHDIEPYTICRKNYQSQSGLKKKNIDELLFYGRRK